MHGLTRTLFLALTMARCTAFMTLVHHPLPRHSLLHVNRFTEPIKPPTNPIRGLTDLGAAFWEFGRPHVLIGTGVGVVSTFRFADPMTPLPSQLASMLWASFLCSLINVYITGTNQIHDVPIDVINKPDLMIPSGRLRLSRARRFIKTALWGALILGGLPLPWNSRPLFILLFLSAGLGHLYSTPPFRFKRNPYLALLCIVLVRGILQPSLVYMHALGRARGLLRPDLVRLSGTMVYFSLLAVVIAVMKDVPDSIGDLAHGIGTFSLHYGSKRVMCFANWVHRILSLMAGMVFLLLTHQNLRLLRPWRVLLQTLIGWGFLREASLTPYHSRDAQKSYQRLWRFFYISYLILPLLAVF